MAEDINAGLAARLARLDEIADRFEIEECLKRVSRGIDRFDRAMFLSAYHPDAVIDAGALVGDPASVYDNGAALHEEGQSHTLHHLTNHRCELDGDTAHAETYFLYAGANRDGTNWVAGGRYVDRIERRDGEWRIAFRFTSLEWSGAMEANQVPLFAGESDRSLNGVTTRDQNDVSYVRPLNNRRATSLLGDPRDYSRPKE